jgi:hypothetical protein
MVYVLLVVLFQKIVKLLLLLFFVLSDLPIVGTPHTSYSEKEGKNVTLNCTVQAYPQVSEITWRKDGAALNVSSANSGKYSIGNPDTPSLTIYTLTKSDSGHYTCEATNSMGSTVGNVIRLDVLREWLLFSNKFLFRRIFIS